MTETVMMIMGGRKNSMSWYLLKFSYLFAITLPHLVVSSLRLTIPVKNRKKKEAVKAKQKQKDCRKMIGLKFGRLFKTV